MSCSAAEEVARRGCGGPVVERDGGHHEHRRLDARQRRGRDGERDAADPGVRHVTVPCCTKVVCAWVLPT